MLLKPSPRAGEVKVWKWVSLRAGANTVNIALGKWVCLVAKKSVWHSNRQGQSVQHKGKRKIDGGKGRFLRRVAARRLSSQLFFSDCLQVSLKHLGIEPDATVDSLPMFTGQKVERIERGCATISCKSRHKQQTA